MSRLLLAGYLSFLFWASLFPLAFQLPQEDVLAIFFRGHGLSLTDAIANVVVYLPYGWLLAHASRTPRKALAVAGLTSLLLECGQIFIPGRVPTPWDFLLNVAGAWAGVRLARGLPSPSELAERWFQDRQQTRWALALMAVWLGVELYPFVPVTDVDYLREGVGPLMAGVADLTGMDWSRVVLRTIATLGVGIAWLSSLHPDVRSVKVLASLFGAVLAAKICVVGRELTLEAVVGTAMGLLLLALARWVARPRTED